MKGKWFVAFSITESLLAAGLLLLAAWLFWGPASSESVWPRALSETLPPYASSELALAVCLCLGCYWLLQVLGRSRAAFWTMALFVLLPCAPSVWAHNQLYWQRFYGADASVGAGHSLFVMVSMFLLCLVGLFVLYQAMGLRQLGSRLSLQRAEEADGDRLIASEALVLLGVIAAGLLVAFLVALAGTALVGAGPSLGRIPWAVVTIGGGAAVLFAGFLLLWFRGRGSEREQ